MQTYLPKDSASGTGYAEGGGLYALGLIHANHGGEITDYLIGACLFQMDSFKVSNVLLLKGIV